MLLVWRRPRHCGTNGPRGQLRRVGGPSRFPSGQQVHGSCGDGLGPGPIVIFCRAARVVVRRG
eukprot:6984065-Lingulodinium_polyedra.AAC.1